MTSSMSSWQIMLVMECYGGVSLLGGGFNACIGRCLDPDDIDVVRLHRDAPRSSCVELVWPMQFHSAMKKCLIGWPWLTTLPTVGHVNVRCMESEIHWIFY